MKINDVIKKCIKIPGISIKQAEYSMELILNTKEGKGSMTFFSLFPGLSLAYIFINSPTWTAPDLRSDSSITKGPLLLNYCVTGRCEMILNNKNFVYIKDRELSLTECFAQKEYVYPKRIYEGLEFFIDIDTFTLENTQRCFVLIEALIYRQRPTKLRKFSKNYGNYMIFRPLLQSFK